MANHWGRDGRGGSGRRIPLEVARRIANERDRLAEEVERLRRRNERLSEALDEAKAGESQRDDELRERLADAEERVRELRDELEDERDSGEESTAGEVEALKERLAKLKNELDRVRRRADEAAETARREERIRLLSGLGEALESIERGLAMQPEGPAREGLEAIYSQLLEFLRREGATLTGELGQEMDPRRHEAVEVVDETDAESGTIVGVSRRGVVLEDGSVALPAKVQVAA